MIHQLRPRHYSPRQTPNVVVADYDPDEASALGEALVEDGYSVTIVSTSAELTEILCRPRTPLQHVECVVTTAMLFDLGGDAARELVGDPPDFLLVVLTETLEEREAAVRLNAAAIHELPVRLDDVRAAVQRAVAPGARN